jgi:hypothetical protein
VILIRHTHGHTQTAMTDHTQHTYHMWLTADTHTFSSSLHTVTLHVTVFNVTVSTNLSKQHTASIFTVQSYPNTKQHTATMQMRQNKLAPLLTPQCYIYNIPHQQHPPLRIHGILLPVQKRNHVHKLVFFIQHIRCSNKHDISFLQIHII